MSELTFRTATEADLPAIVTMMADDDIGENREQGGAGFLPDYAKAFADMNTMPGNGIVLAERDGEIVGSLHLAFIPGLSRRGTRRALVESLRVVSGKRGQSIGTALMKHAIGLAREAGCGLVQLTSDKRRHRAHLFYRRLGFEQSHEGFKLGLD